MTLLLTLVLPLYMIIGFGFLAGAGKWLDATHASALLAFVFKFAMPVAVFNFFITSPPVSPDVLGMMAGYGLAAATLLVISMLVGVKLHKFSMPVAGGHSFTSVCGNAVFLGLPMAMMIEDWGPPFLMLMIVEGVFVFSAGAALMTWPSSASRRENAPPAGRASGPGAQSHTLSSSASRQLVSRLSRERPAPAGRASGPGAQSHTLSSSASQREAPAAGRILQGVIGGMGRALTNPIVVAALSGAILSLFRPDLPAPLAIFLDMLGATAGPTALFVIGLTLATLPREGFAAALPSVASVNLIKLLILPLVSVALVALFTGADPLLMGVTALFTVMPPAVSAVVQGAHYGVFEREAAASVMVGTIISILPISIVLALFAG